MSTDAIPSPPDDVGLAARARKLLEDLEAAAVASATVEGAVLGSPLRPALSMNHRDLARALEYVWLAAPRGRTMLHLATYVLAREAALVKKELRL